MLHLTNGDMAVPALVAAGVDGEILPWSEVLHDGPVPGGLEVGELRAVRARFLGDRDGTLARRDARLAAAITAGEPLMLWLEADLYDLLLAIQIVERLRAETPARMVLVGQDEWRSVTEVEPAELRELGRDAPAVTPEQRELARAAWGAFTAASPFEMEKVAAGTPALPALAIAFGRLLEELPWRGDGLGRTERQLLEALATGASTREEAFMATVEREQRPFLGDASAWAALDRLAPLLDGVRVNERGRAVLRGEQKWVPVTERWVGGTRLPPGPSPWHWDPEARRVYEDLAKRC